MPDVCLACQLEITALEETVTCAGVSGQKFTGWRRKLPLWCFELTQWTKTVAAPGCAANPSKGVGNGAEGNGLDHCS